jgi:hypothetical protein
MPKELERKLKAEARARGYSKKRTDAFVYGTLRKMGWKPKREEKDMSLLAKLSRLVEGEKKRKRRPKRRRSRAKRRR